MDFVTLLRIATMLVFITVFLGIGLWLLTPAGRRRANDQGRMILEDDVAPRPKDGTAPRPKDGTAPRPKDGAASRLEKAR